MTRYCRWLKKTKIRVTRKVLSDHDRSQVSRCVLILTHVIFSMVISSTLFLIKLLTRLNNQIDSAFLEKYTYMVILKSTMIQKNVLCLMLLTQLLSISIIFFLFWSDIFKLCFVIFFICIYIVIAKCLKILCLSILCFKFH